ncbi:uncharacterized protein LOC134784037, partial [Penaeus indicus]|uniref:uncharacterized protein LOC134784037 n=1 Tax=Penaeus indicus TaxID=29960 RepID=UPI00300C4D2E
MAKFRFPGKALKLNTRKRVRFRGGHAANTPEELYTRRIRRGLDLFTQIFGDSDEDDDEFEGFTSIFPEPRDIKGKKKKSVGSPRKKSGRRSPAERAEEACVTLEEAGLVTRRKISTVEMAIKEVQETSDIGENVPVFTRRRGGGGGDTAPSKEVREGPSGGKEVMASTRRRTSNVELPAKEVSENLESSTDLPVVTRRRVSGLETPMRDVVKEGGAENSKDPPMVTRRRGHSLEGVVKEVQEGADSIPGGGERTSEKRDLPPQPASKENVEIVVPSEQPVQESAALQEMKMAVISSRPVARKQTARRVSRTSSTVKTALAKKLLARAKAKRTVNSLPVVGEKSPKRFVLPSMSVRSSRIIKPNKRLFADITEMCTASSSLESSLGGEMAEHASMPSKRLVKLTRKGRGAHTQFLSLPRSRAQSTDSLSSTEGGVGRDRMRRTISLYTESITGPSKAQVGRPPKRLLRRMDPPQQEVEAELPDSPQRCDPKESRVMEKIGKLLRSPWDDRLKQSSKVGRGEEEGMPASAFGASSPMSASAISRNILRKARLNLNKTTLQKIRNPVSLQRLIPASDEGVEGKCAVCDSEEGGNSRKFGVIVCEKCNSFISNSSDGSREVYECKDSKAECQVQELVEGRCNACWLGRILLICSLPNLLHDRLRKRLPNILKEQIPTSLARCMSGGNLPVVSEKDAELATHTKRLPLDPGGGGAFGSVMDLPGGWKRKTGSEVIVISPSGEKFKSIQKLEEFLKKQGITTDARVLFGNSSPAVVRSNEPKSRPSPPTNNSSRGKVVMTTLPGGWVRRIKWRSAGDRFDTYVYSPDGRTFRSRRELSAYFQLIGKVDDIHKYFPVVTGHSDASIPSSSDTTGSSSTERLSSSEPCSEISSDDKSPEASECETETPQSRMRSLSRNAKEKMKYAQLKQAKVMNHKEGHLRSKSVSSLKSVKSVDKKSEVQMEVNVSSEAKAAEKKYKKPKIVARSRSLSLGRKKGDASLTDTTESESENRNSGKGFTKTFSKRLKNKPKAAVCELSPTNKTLSAGSNNVSEDSEKTSPSASMASPEETVEESEVQKLEEVKDDTAVFIKPDDVPRENQFEKGKIVLKIQKKSIEPVDRRRRHKSKKDKRKKVFSEEESESLSKEQVAQSGAEAVQNMTAEKVLAQLSSTSKSSEDAKEKIFSINSEDQEKDLVGGESDIPAGMDVSDDSKFSSPMVSESEPIHETIKVPEAKPKSKPKKPSSYQTSHFGGGWSRKIKWNEKGEGKVALLHSPDGQTFRSRIELLAYFKKAGKSKGNLDYYFPPVLKREDYNEQLEKKQMKAAAAEVAVALGTSTSGQSSEVSEFSDSEIPKTSEDSCVSGEECTKRNVTKIVKCYRKLSGQASLKSIPENVGEDSAVSQILSGKASGGSSLSEEAWKHGSQLGKMSRKDAFAAGMDSKQIVKSESEEIDGTHPEVGGPRVKHVCRSQAQVLGIPRAVFPSPGKDEDKAPIKVIVPSSKSDKKRKIVTVTTTASGKVLRKTQWCNKCPGCTTPNCRKCVNCLDMKKYGGPGTKKKPC